jgi:molecular chaperone IbpA
MTLDFTPFKAFSVGFDDLFNELSKIKTVGYPPYNIEKVKDGEYKISMALAGFGKSEIDVTVKENVLKVKGKKDKSSVSDFLYKGIGERSFEQAFKLAEYTNVVKADYKDVFLKYLWNKNFQKKNKKRKLKYLN